jgi:hypothetical protein
VRTVKHSPFVYRPAVEKNIGTDWFTLRSRLLAPRFAASLLRCFAPSGDKEKGKSTNVVNRFTGETHNFNSNLKAGEFRGKSVSTLYIIIKRKNFYLNREYLVYKSYTPYEEIINSAVHKEAISLLNDT